MVQGYFPPAASDKKSSGEILEFTISYGQMEKIHATNVSFRQVKPRGFPSKVRHLWVDVSWRVW